MKCKWIILDKDERLFSRRSPPHDVKSKKLRLQYLSHNLIVGVECDSGSTSSLFPGYDHQHNLTGARNGHEGCE